MLQGGHRPRGTFPHPCSGSSVPQRASQAGPGDPAALASVCGAKGLDAPQ